MPTLSKSSADEWYKTFTKFRVSREKTWTPKIYADLKKLVTDGTAFGDINSAITYLPFLQAPQLNTTIQNMYIDAGKVFGSYAYQSVMRQVRAHEQKHLLPIGYDEDLVNTIIQYFQEYLLSKAVLPITDTMKEWMLLQFTKAQQEGRSIQDVADEMIKADFPKNRAIVIARTETVKAANYGAVQGAKKTGYKTNKQWVAARDFRTRRLPRDAYSHLAMDGINIPIDEDFKVPMKRGGVDDISQPGAPNGDAGNTIMCRCTVGFVLQTGTDGLPVKL